MLFTPKTSGRRRALYTISLYGSNFPKVEISWGPKVKNPDRQMKRKQTAQFSTIKATDFPGHDYNGDDDWLGNESVLKAAPPPSLLYSNIYMVCSSMYVYLARSALRLTGWWVMSADLPCWLSFELHTLDCECEMQISHPARFGSVPQKTSTCWGSSATCGMQNKKIKRKKKKGNKNANGI